MSPSSGKETEQLVRLLVALELLSLQSHQLLGSGFRVLVHQVDHTLADSGDITGPNRVPPRWGLSIEARSCREAGDLADHSLVFLRGNAVVRRGPSRPLFDPFQDEAQ